MPNTKKEAGNSIGEIYHPHCCLIMFRKKAKKVRSSTIILQIKNIGKSFAKNLTYQARRVILFNECIIHKQLYILE